MDHTPESHLQQAAKLAGQAAAQMRKAVTLAEQATQLLQMALAQANLELPSETPAPVQMSVAAPKRKQKPHIRPETTKQIESTVLRQAERLSIPTSVAEHTIVSPSENAWDDGDNWWKPLRPDSSSDAS